ncbi:ABC transporter ATP-binding protein [Williamsia muralis]|uniref:ABC transporter n=1 Tax=Williamsia marianensis TaxID=85044 RepID=A0A2G3PQB1_WILMA|nr:ATP-binding cassette domain-containing protein [Williamsia marianensis]PHV68039.1 ABC transporter [Williamsia marianensis]
MITARAIGVRFGGTTVLSDIDFDVAPGRVSGIIGRSGSGKTTLLQVLAGIRPPDAGVVRFAGRARAPRGSVAMIDQHPRLVCNPRWTLSQIIREPADIRRRPVDPDKYAARTGLDPELLGRFPSQVSDGQLQRACLARVLVQEPAYLLCDEPTAMLDPIAAADVASLLSSIAAQGVGMALVSHDRTLVEQMCSTITTLTGPGVS